MIDVFVSCFSKFIYVIYVPTWKTSQVARVPVGVVQSVNLQAADDP